MLAADRSIHHCVPFLGSGSLCSASRPSAFLKVDFPVLERVNVSQPHKLMGLTPMLTESAHRPLKHIGGAPFDSRERERRLGRHPDEVIATIECGTEDNPLGSDRLNGRLEQVWIKLRDVASNHNDSFIAFGKEPAESLLEPHTKVPGGLCSEFPTSSIGFKPWPIRW